MHDAQKEKMANSLPDVRARSVASEPGRCAVEGRLRLAHARS